MTQPVPAGAHPSAAGVFDGVPAIRQEPGARERIRASHAGSGRRIAVLDDDPTGSQAVHHVSVVTVLDAVEYAHALDVAGYRAWHSGTTNHLTDAALLVELHESRMASPHIPPAARAESTQWLKDHRAAEATKKDTPTPPKARGKTKPRGTKAEPAAKLAPSAAAPIHQ